MNKYLLEHYSGTISWQVFTAGAVLILSTLIPFSAAAAQASPYKFCAKPWPLSGSDFVKLEQVANNILDGKRDIARMWPQRMIPYAVDPKLKSDDMVLYTGLREAARHISKHTNLTMVECPLQLVEKTNAIKGYIYASRSKLWCEGGCCATNVGYRPKSQWGFLKVARARNELSRGSVIGIGGRACHPNANSTGGIMHELLHAIGLNHAHQNPASRDYIRYPGFKNLSQCMTERDWHWLKQYDPASIMHYKLGSCNFELRKSKANPEKDVIEDLINSGEICGYNSTSGAACFETSQFDTNQCISFTDQAWLYSAYRNVQEDDSFKLQQYIDNNQCEVIN